MAWRVFADTFLTADLAADAVSHYQKFSPHSDILMSMVRVWIIAYNNPTFTNLKAKLYSNKPDGTPGRVIATSETILTKAQIITSTNGAKEIYFKFNDPYGIPLKSGDFYHIVLEATGYTYSDSSHLAWVKAWPDAGYSVGYTPTYVNLGVAPKRLAIIGATF